MSPLVYFDHEGRASYSRLPVRLVRCEGEWWLYWRTGRHTSSGFRLLPIRDRDEASG